MAAFGTGNQPAAAVPTGGAAGFGTFNLPNFVGELFKLSPLETPLLSMIGGLSGGEQTNTVKFTWQDTLHRAPALTATDRGRIEGDDATFQVQSRTERVNVVEIFQYGVELTYTKQAATGLLGTAGLNATQGTSAESILGSQPVQNEMAWQLQVKIEQAALDAEISMLNGTFAYPNDGTARQTQGIVGAVSTLALDADLAAGFPGLVTAPDPVTGRIAVNGLAQALYNNGAPMRNMVLMVGAASKLLISSDFQQGNGNIAPRSYNVFGVNVTDIETDFGRFPIVLNRHVPAETVLALEMDVLKPKFMPIPGKGHFFLEPLAKSGSYDRQQLYGELGLQYGPEGWHAKVVDFDGVSATA